MDQQKNEEPVFVTDDKQIRERGKLDEADKEILDSMRSGEGLKTINKEELMELAKAASEKFDAYRLFAKYHMTKDQADFVRKLRVDEGYSWRAIAHRCFEENWDGWLKWEPPSNQIMGMALCERAAEFFGEDYERKPWN